MEQSLRVGEKAPDFRALAAGSGREVSLEGCAGRRCVLIFHTQGTVPTAEAVNKAVRERYPSPEEVLVASVVDLSFVPPVYWLTASLIVGQAYQQAATQIPSGQDPADYIIILQDWGGLVSQRFGASGVGRRAAVVVIDEESEIAGYYQGEEPAGAVLRALDGAYEEDAPGNVP